MSNNLQIPCTGAGTATPTISTDDVGGAHIQRVKLVASADGSAAELTKAEDSAHASGDHGIVALVVRKDTAAQGAGTDGDYTVLITDANGRLHVLDQNSAAALTALQILDDWDESDRAKVNPIVGQAGIAAGAGAVGATVPRVTLASDDPAVAALQILDNAISGNEMQVDIVAELPAGTQFVGTVGNLATTIAVTPTITAGAYAAGEAIGGKQTLTSIVRTSGGKCLLTDIVVLDDANQKAALELLFFESDPSAATITDTDAFVFSTDFAKVIHRQSVSTVDYVTIDSNAIATLPNINVLLQASGSANLYVAVVLASGTPTYASTSDLKFLYKAVQL